jgi:hypothetical protein
MREYVLLSTDFEESLTREAALKVTLESLKNEDSIKECYICRYQENDRMLSGYFNKDGKITDSIVFPNDKLLPDGFLEDAIGTVIFLPIANKNVIYGYAVLVVDTNKPGFINEKIEFIFLQAGQVINKLDLYQKYFGIADIMDLYIKDSLTCTEYAIHKLRKLISHVSTKNKVYVRKAVLDSVSNTLLLHHTAAKSDYHIRLLFFNRLKSTYITENSVLSVFSYSTGII